jgi:hypothetical protein
MKWKTAYPHRRKETVVNFPRTRNTCIYKYMPVPTHGSMSQGRNSLPAEI